MKIKIRSGKKFGRHGTTFRNNYCGNRSVVSGAKQ